MLLPRASASTRLFLPGPAIQPDLFARHTEPQEVAVLALLGPERHRVARALGGGAGADAWITPDQVLVLCVLDGENEADELASGVLAWSAAQLVLYAAPQLSPAVLTRLRLLSSLVPSSTTPPPQLLVSWSAASGNNAAMELAALRAAVGAAVRSVSALPSGPRLLASQLPLLRHPVVLRDWNRALARTATELRSNAPLTDCTRLLL